jgi:hypothetical protein
MYPKIDGKGSDQRKRLLNPLAIALAAFLLLDGNAYAAEKVISPEEAEWIGRLIFQNECADKDSALLAWNDGESFPSLGIGHFIWYPENYQGPFDESFPKLLQYLEKKGVLLPDWFKTVSKMHAPWATKADFLKAIQNGELNFLREFLIETKKEQSIFLIERFSDSILKMLEAVPQNSQRAIYQKLSVVLKADNGLYPLVDYVNFNGEGILESERYKGEGWGLLQVLEEMNVPSEDGEVVPEFVKAVERVLDRRVSNSPPERNEMRWLPGWKVRVRTDLAPEN